MTGQEREIIVELEKEIGWRHNRVPVTKWEYRLKQALISDRLKLHALRKERWELAKVIATQETSDGEGEPQCGFCFIRLDLNEGVINIHKSDCIVLRAAAILKEGDQP